MKLNRLLWGSMQSSEVFLASWADSLPSGHKNMTNIVNSIYFEGFEHIQKFIASLRSLEQSDIF